MKFAAEVIVRNNMKNALNETAHINHRIFKVLFLENVCAINSITSKISQNMKVQDIQ